MVNKIYVPVPAGGSGRQHLGIDRRLLDRHPPRLGATGGSGAASSGAKPRPPRPRRPPSTRGEPPAAPTPTTAAPVAPPEPVEPGAKLTSCRSSSNASVPSAASASCASSSPTTTNPRAGLLGDAVALLADIEARWSRFRPDSELSALNAHAGAPVFTSTDTAAVVALALEAWRATGGLFDPTIHDALVASGYDRSFDELVPPAAGVARSRGRDRR